MTVNPATVADESGKQAAVTGTITITDAIKPSSQQPQPLTPKARCFSCFRPGATAVHMSACLFVQICLHVTCANKSLRSGIADVILMLARLANSEGMNAAGIVLQATAHN